MNSIDRPPRQLTSPELDGLLDERTEEAEISGAICRVKLTFSPESSVEFSCKLNTLDPTRVDVDEVDVMIALSIFNESRKSGGCVVRLTMRDVTIDTKALSITAYSFFGDKCSLSLQNS